MSTIANDVEVVGTEDHFEQAPSQLRARTLRRAGVTGDAEGAGLVYIVRASDGSLF